MGLLRKKKLKALLFLFFSFGLVICVYAADPPTSYYKDAKRGYYWYEVVPQKPDETKKDEVDNKEKRKAPVTKSYEELWVMHPDDFQKYVTEVQKYAVQFPTEENVERYYYTNMIATKKAKAFASVAAVIGQKNPDLSTEGTYPITAPGIKARTLIKGNEQEAVLNSAKNNFGLIMFESRGCGFCDSQKGILSFFIRKYKWPIKYVDIHDNPALVAVVGVEQTPTLILIKNGVKDFMPISSGVISMDEMVDRIYKAVRYLNGDIKPEQMEMHEYQRNTPDDPLTPTRLIKK